MEIPPFTYPFTIGLLFIISFLLVVSVIWILSLSKIDKIRIIKKVPGRKSLQAVGETFMEALLHRKIFRKNPVLGYMHASLAFGWFLLIVAGHVEAAVHYKTLSFPFWKSIFFRYAEPLPPAGFEGKAFAAIMDFLLLLILSGVALAYYKRLNSRAFGMKKTTKLKVGDRIALTALWLIFPLRLAAESISAGLHGNGSFLTQPTGNLLAAALPLHFVEQPAWWAYSCALGAFFLAMPMSRYMHIPVEVLLIFLRKYGVRLKKQVNGYTRVQVFSCSRCGICLDSCQMSQANIRNTQSVYVLKQIRGRRLSDEQLFNCLLCGRCQKDCPVGLDLNDIRITQRIESTVEYNSTYDYLKNGPSPKTDVIYFAGCMTHLTPSIKKSMKQLLNLARINYWFMDEQKAPCCGRPLIQAGQYEAAKKLIANNRDKILQSEARILVVSCPICYKVFREDYDLPHIRVMHHSEYLLELVNQGLLPARRLSERVVYHDPCELGRGSSIYEQPRELLEQYVNLVKIKQEKADSPCCGGSLSNIKITMDERNQIRDQVLEEYQQYQPDTIVTACPLCKKTFTKGTDVVVRDLAEIVWESVSRQPKPTRIMIKKSKPEEILI
ncbi:(Fe-S)-binding protein [Gaoshiqia sp. Z1-71]|uniref:(Fe-S)-binding protein n=1 Tax=Gaoshiqia hydrogeniformans TaxID=3290090 RepID=UPI003BF8C47A